MIDKLKVYYKDIIVSALHIKGKVVLGITALFIVSMFGFGWVEFVFFADSDRNMITIDINLPEGTKIELTLETTATDTLTIAVNAKPIKTQSNGSVFKGVFTSMKSEMVDLFFSNEQLLNYEAYQFNIKTVRDAYPELSIDMVSDSLNWNELQFDGIASDDYAITDVLMQYRPVGESEEPLEIQILVTKIK